MMMVPALLSAALLLLPGILTTPNEPVPITVVVENSLLGSSPLTFNTQVAKGGILVGALTRLMHSNANFKFTSSENPDYGVYLESVNGVAGNDQEHTYWQLLVPNEDGEMVEANVGIGCYIPSAGEKIILRFTKW